MGGGGYFFFVCVSQYISIVFYVFLGVLFFICFFSYGGLNSSHAKNPRPNEIKNTNSKLNNPTENNNINTINSNSNSNSNSNRNSNSNLASRLPSIKNIIEYKTDLSPLYPYFGILEGKDNSKFKFGIVKLFPDPSDYNNIPDTRSVESDQGDIIRSNENIFDWESRIRHIVSNELVPGQTYDIGVLGHNILKQRYVTYGRHFLLNSTSNIETIISLISGNIDSSSVTRNSGEIGVAENDDELELGLHVIICSLRPVSFDAFVEKAANKVLLKTTLNKSNKIVNKNEISKLNNKRIKALFNSIPNSNKMSDFGTLINSH